MTTVSSTVGGAPPYRLTEWTKLPISPYISRVEDIAEIVEAIKHEGAFVFDVETRGVISRHREVMDMIEAEWKQKKLTLKSNNENVIRRSREAIEERWRKSLALDPLRNEVFWIAIAVGGRSWVIPMGHQHGELLTPEEVGDGTTVPPPGYRKLLKNGNESTAKARYYIPPTYTAPPTQLSQGEVFAALEEVFMDPNIMKINQNVKFDCKSVAKYYGGELPHGVWGDTMVSMHVLNENLMAYSLEKLCHHVFRQDPYARDGKLGKIIENVPFSSAVRYGHLDARWAYMLFDWNYRKVLKQDGLFRSLRRDMEVCRVLGQMEMNGIQVNPRAIKQLSRELLVELEDKRMTISLSAPVGFNPNSTDAKRKLFFGKKSEGGLGLKPGKMTDGGKPSVDMETLKALKGEHPLVDTFLEYSELDKLKSGFVDGMPARLHKGRLHPQFHLHRTTTARLSSSDPNLQNIPTDERMRALFTAAPGEMLIVADYSQIEMRVFAMFSQDPALIHIFENGIDIHTGTASVIYRVPPEEVTPEQRKIGKVANFLMGYGGTAKRLYHSSDGALTMEQAQAAVDGYNTGYKVMTGWKNQQIIEARRRGFVETMGGRRRRVPDITSANKYDRIRAERQAINAIIQGTASEICKDAMIRLDKDLPFPRCRMLLQVHDELVTSVPEDETKLWIPVIEEGMGNGTRINGIELSVDAHAGFTWAEAKG